MSGYEVSRGSFANLAVGQDIRLVQTTDATITRFEPVTTPGMPGRLAYGIVRGGLLDGTEQWQWVPNTDAEAKAMGMKLFIRTATPKVGTLRNRPADGSVWSATDEPGLYACVGSGSEFKVGSLAYRVDLGELLDGRS